ncbi:hypothetical protein [Pantoea sp. AG702]|uniref:hypothetical protein n=1 Tax=Pantoea sp. AG702 TaxID=2183907 RepID=UPI000D7132CF|nr:hypothetical protein [Pantoea sp. AG702]PWW12438.1 hypothetical protein DFO57_108211 [Pantoea sp. AG702]
MFQISAGVFFEQNKIEKHDGIFVFYSNVDVFFPIENELPYFKINKTSHDGVNSYVVNYNLLTEKPERIEAGVVIRAGDEDYMQQFILLWEFYFDCVARVEKESVKNICAQLNFNKKYSKTVLEVAPYLVEINKHISIENANGFSEFVKNVVSLERAAYKSTIAALKIISDSKESLSTNFDLTYSMLVYALESLSQKNDSYRSVWDDYDQKGRGELDVVFKNISSEQVDRIKGILIDGKQFKLQKRFKDFIFNNIEDSYFYESTRYPIRYSFLGRALDNLYKIRSSFVHELKPLDAMISKAYNPVGDNLVLFGEPYFTYSGLLRLLRHVIMNFCKKNPSHKRESINWVMETSSVMVAQVSAHHWLWEPSGFTAQGVNKWFSEYLNMLNFKKVTNLQAIMDKIENIYDQSKKEYKNGLLSFYFFYNLIHNEDRCEWYEFANKRSYILIEDIYWYASSPYLYSSFTNTINGVANLKTLRNFLNVFEVYDKNKFKPNRLNLPAMTEVIMLLCAANSFFRIGLYKDYILMVNRALKEIAAVKTLFDYIKKCATNSQLIDLVECLRLCREVKD